MPKHPTLATLAADLDAGRTTARKLVEECLARIADPAGEGARTFLHVDKDAAIAAADAMDQLRKAKAAPSPFAGIPVSIKDLFDIRGQVTRAGSRALEGFRAGGGRRAGGGAVARGRLRCDRPHQHDRIRLFRHRHQSAFRHAEERLQSQRRACARRFVVGCRGIDRRRHGVWRARHRYRRLLPDSGGLQRHRRLQADASPYSARRRRAAVVLARQLRPAWRARSPAARRSMPCSPTSPCSRCSRAP